MTDVSIVFVNYNTIKLLENAIDSVFENSRDFTFEVIVVDNDSKDDSEQIIAQKYQDRVIYLKLPENMGFGRANNEGFKVANGRNILCLNPDTLLQNNAIKILSDYLDYNPKVGVVGSQLYNADGTLQPSYSFFYPSLKSNLNDLFGGLFRKKVKIQKNPIKVKSVFGASMMIKNEVIRKTNGFNPRFFMYAEEEEWCYRINKLGYLIVCLPESKVTHLDGGSFEFSEQRENRRMEGAYTFYSVLYNSSKVRNIYAVIKLTCLSRIFAFKLLRKSERVCYWKYKYNWIENKFNN